MKIDIQNLQNVVRLDRKKILKCASHVLRSMGESRAELSLLFVTDAYIRNLNWKYRRVDSVTDVLAFPMREGKDLSKNSPILGDVVISIETAKKQARKRKIPFYKELNLYLVHGILHLLGYDDEKARDKKRMREKEKKLLESVCSNKG